MAVPAAPVSPRLAGLRPRVRRDIRTFTGSLFFIGGGIVALLGLAVPHPQQLDEVGYAGLAVAMIVFGLFLLLLLPPRLIPHVPPVGVAVGIVAATLAVYFNGEAHGGPPQLNEIFYLWPTLYVGYFLSRQFIVAALLLTASVYATALHYMHLPLEDASSRWVVVVLALSAGAAAAHALRTHVDALVQRLHQLARTDALTGLLNRRAFDERLQGEIQRTIRTNTPLALLLGDVDHFKAINDRLGHAAGDEALAHVAQTLTGTARTVDTVARVGGEEFALLLPGTDLAGAMEAAERLRAALATSPDGLTMSFGVVEAPQHGHTPDDLLRAADRALYTAKQRGRDRAVAPEGATAQEHG
ncbi:MAG TPA: GGDEF domain-containing protein [Solirubrobacteraceae bacterium]|nr:GGDEF domain-containing protein [Solirubrobacteraceae bacterium]